MTRERGRVDLLLSMAVAVDAKGKTLLMLAVQDPPQNRSAVDPATVVASILTEPCGLNWRDNKGRTALMLAARAAAPEVLELLMAAGAELDLKCDRGFSAFDKAKRGGHEKCSNLLEAAGCLPAITPAAPQRQWDELTQNGDVVCEVATHGARPAKTLVVSTSSQSGATGMRIWECSHVLFRHLKATGVLRQPQHILELGSGTGFLALLLAAAGAKGSRVIATDQPTLVRTMKFNANRNHLRHAVQCLSWDWSEDPPDQIDWGAITMCVASDLVYYQESNAQEQVLAQVLRLILERCRPSTPLHLMMRMRAQASGGARLVIPARGRDEETDAEGAARAVPARRFLREALPRVGLRADPVPVSEYATNGDPSFHLFAVSLGDEMPADGATAIRARGKGGSCNTGPGLTKMHPRPTSNAAVDSPVDEQAGVQIDLDFDEPWTIDDFHDPSEPPS